jgi:catechol O-methyltransferase
LGKQSKQELK